MKKMIYMAAMVASSLLMTSCFSTGGNALGGLASAMTGNAASTTTTSSTLAQGTSGIVGNLLSTLLGGAATNQKTIVGTWTYQAPEVRFESENVLSQLGGTLASNKIESMLDTQLQRIGMTKGKSSFTFNSDGTMSVTVNGKTTKGTYTLDSKTKTITITGVMGLTKTSCTVAVQGNTMYMLFDTDKILSLATKISSASSATSTLSSLLGNYNGMKLGWSMTK